MSDYPASAWGSRDRATAAQARGFVPVAEMLTAQPAHLVPPGFELHPRHKPSDAERARKVDALLEAAGIGRR